MAPAPYIAPGAYYNPVSDRLVSIEVYKGADLLKYGPNKMYGAVNYITALPPQKPTLRLKLSGGENGYASGLFSYGGNWGNTAALVEGVYKNFGGYTNNSSVEILNLNAKVYTQLSGNQSLYFKVSGQFEDNQASLASQTPFTFGTDPLQNPLDADTFTMRRYGVDIIHKWLPTDNLSLTTKAYASDFERDWWRQITTKVLASGVRTYVGEEIFADRYGYLENRTFGPEDYVIVGRVDDGREGTTDSRWTYRVSGLKATLEQQWAALGQTSMLELGLNIHRETFKDVLLQNNDSRWARSGETTTDLWYRLWAANGYLRNHFQFGDWGMVPILRFEHVDMYRQDLLALSQDPDLEGSGSGLESSIYDQFLPGFTLERKLDNGELYASVYQGMIAPSKVFGFLVQHDGVVSAPLAGEAITMEPELSWNKELGWRGGLWGNRVQGQLTYFHNASRNFYAAGRNEVFQELGKIHVQGLEMALDVQLFESPGQRLHFLGNMTLLHSKVKAGLLEDRDLFSQIVHGSATRGEYIEKVNAHREAFEIYVDRGSGEVPFTDPTLDAADFDAIARGLVRFGDGGIGDAQAPYTPTVSMSLGLNYDLRGFSAGLGLHHVGKQFTAFHNFVNESPDGAIGELPAFTTIDAFVNHDFELGEGVELTFFVNGKNLADKLYRAS